MGRGVVTFEILLNGEPVGRVGGRVSTTRSDPTFRRGLVAEHQELPELDPRKRGA